MIDKNIDIIFNYLFEFVIIILCCVVLMILVSIYNYLDKKYSKNKWWKTIETIITYSFIGLMLLFIIYEKFHTNLLLTILIGLTILILINLYRFWDKYNEVLMLILFIDLKTNLLRKLEEMDKMEESDDNFGTAYIDLQLSIGNAKKRLEKIGGHYHRYNLFLKGNDEKQ